MERVRTGMMEDLAVIVDTAARSLDSEAMLRWSFGQEGFEEGSVAISPTTKARMAAWLGAGRRGRSRDSRWIPPDAREEHEGIGPAPPDEETEILGDHVARHAAFWGWVGGTSRRSQ